MDYAFFQPSRELTV